MKIHLKDESYGFDGRGRMKALCDTFVRPNTQYVNTPGYWLSRIPEEDRCTACLASYHLQLLAILEV